MKVAEAMTGSVATVAPDSTLKEAAEIMVKHDIGMLGVAINKEIIGTVTDRDLSVNGAARGADPRSVRVGDVMTPGVVSCPGDADLEKAAELMQKNKIRRLMVTADRSAVGVLSLGDLARSSEDPELVSATVKRVS